MAEVLFANHLSKVNHTGGAELTLLWLARRCLATSGMAPLLLSDQEGLITRQAGQAGVPQVFMPHEMNWGLLNDEFDASRHVPDFIERYHDQIDRLTAMIKDRRIDCTMVNSIVNLLPAVASKRIGVPVIWLIHEKKGAFPSKGIFKRVKRWIRNDLRFLRTFLYQFADEIVFNSVGSCRSFGFDPDEDRVHVIYPPIRDELWRGAVNERSFPENRPFTFGFCGYFTEHKGVHDFLYAACRILENRKDVRFVIAGPSPDPDLTKEKMKEIQRAGHSDRIQYAGVIEDVKSFFDQIDCLVVPPVYREPFGLAAAEAMHLGIPLIIYRTAGIAELLRQGSGSLLIGPSRRLLLRSMKALMQDRNGYRQLSIRASETVRHRLDPQKEFQKYAGIIRRVTNPSSGFTGEG